MSVNVEKPKNYEKPLLVTYGKLTQLTTAGSGQAAEGNGGNSTDPLRKP